MYVASILLTTMSDSEEDGIPDLVGEDVAGDMILEASNSSRLSAAAVSVDEQDVAAEVPEAKEVLPPVPLSILTGWLGSGKTTLLKRILDEFSASGRTVAIVQNEFSDLGVEEGLNVQDDSGAFGEVLELANGCVCCSVRTDFTLALEALMRRRRFDYIVVECSGLADPGPLAKMFWVDSEELESEIYLDGIISVCDAFYLRGHLESKQEHSKQVIHQLAYADRILINKVDLVDAKELDLVVQDLQGINSLAKVFLTTRSDVAMDEILSIHGFDEQNRDASLGGGNAEEDEHTPYSEGDTHDHDHSSTTTTSSSSSRVAVAKFQALARGEGVVHFHDRSIKGLVMEPEDQSARVNMDRLKLWLADLLWAEVYDSGEVSKQELIAQADVRFAEKQARTDVLAKSNSDVDAKGQKIFRMKAVLSTTNSDAQVFLQVVQQLYDIIQGPQWPVDTSERHTRMVVIGRNLDEDTLRADFQSCFDAQMQA